jgi:raffinose/stachyose/melibiose transport system substrate-binding protein
LQVEYDGKSYGVPLASYTVGIATQNDILAQHGVQPPKTWDEMKTAFQTLKDAGVTPFSFGAQDGSHTFFIYIGFASALLGPEGFQQLLRGERKLTDPDLLPAAQLLVDLVPFYNEGFEGTNYDNAKFLFAQGQSAMMPAGTADFTGFKAANPDANIGFIPWPGLTPETYTTNTGYELLYTVSKYTTPEKQEAATKFVVWLASPEAQTLVAENIALPVNKSVTELVDPIKAQTMLVRDRDVPVWYALPETGATYTEITTIQGGLWDNTLTPEQFAEKVQAVIVPTGTAAPATPTA